MSATTVILPGRYFYLRLGLFYLRLVLAAYGRVAWSFLVTIENRFGLSCLRWKPVWSFLLMVAIVRKLFWSFLLTVPLVQKLDLVVFAYGSPSVSKKRRKVSEKTSIASKKDASTLFRCAKRP